MVFQALCGNSGHSSHVNTREKRKHPVNSISSTKWLENVQVLSYLQPSILLLKQPSNAEVLEEWTKKWECSH